MIILDILTEAATTTYGRSKGKVVRKYRCTSGERKGRICKSFLLVMHLLMLKQNLQ